jgi:hypothetical protein
MTALLVLAISVAGVGIGVLAVFGSQFLLRWYLHEMRRMHVVQTPADAIVTYPLA